MSRDTNEPWRARPCARARAARREAVGRPFLGLAAAMALATLTVACSDLVVVDDALEPPAHSSPQATAAFEARLDCRADALELTFTCEPASSIAGEDGVAAAIIGGQHRYVRLTGSNVTEVDGIFSADITVQNLTLQPMATVDGATPHANGVRVFFQIPPTNGVQIVNDDGSGAFLSAGQPFHRYFESMLGDDHILEQGEISEHKRWEFDLNGASDFEFGVLVAANVPDEDDLATRLVQIATGGQITCGLTAGSQVYCWGSNSVGQVGDGTDDNFRTTPRKVLLPDGFAFSAVTVGEAHTCALSTVGTPYCWGAGSFGRLGNGDTSDRTEPEAVDMTNVNSVFVKLTAGAFHTCGLTGSGQVYCWGNNDQGQLGNGTNDPTTVLTPTPVTQGLLHFVDISAGMFFTCALASTSQVHCWGANDYGQLGDGTGDSSFVPTPVVQPVGVAFIDISTATVAANVFACALATSGQVYCWGHGANGTLGNGSNTSSPTPVEVDQGGLHFVSIAVGNGHACALTGGGQAYCWGIGNNGRLGDGFLVDRNTPTAVEQTVDGYIPFVALAPGGNHTCGLTAGGHGYCWGQGEFGRLGAGTTTDRLTPTVVAAME